MRWLGQAGLSTGADVAQAVRSGRADCGVATRAVAQAAGLDFVPLTWERFDLALRQRDYFRPGPQALFKFVRTAAFRDRAAELSGYDVSEAGDVRRSIEASRAGSAGRPMGEARVVTSGRAAILRPPHRSRRDGRVAEGARLESVYTGNRIVGSNPTPSAMKVNQLTDIS